MRVILFTCLLFVVACKEKENRYMCVCKIPSRGMSDTSYVSAKDMTGADNDCAQRQLNWGANGALDVTCRIYQ